MTHATLTAVAAALNVAAAHGAECFTTGAAASLPVDVRMGFALTAIAAATAVADGIEAAAIGKAAASDVGKAAARSLWESVLLIAAAADGDTSAFDAHASKFHAAALPAVVAAALRQGKAEPKQWKTFLNRKSDVRILMSAGYDVLCPLPKDLLFDDATSDKATAYAAAVAAAPRPATQREVQTAVATMRDRAAAAAREAEKQLYPVSIHQPADWTADNIPELYAQFHRINATAQDNAAALGIAQSALQSALNGDPSGEAHKLMADVYARRIEERDEVARLQSATMETMQTELARLRTIEATAVRAFGADCDILATLRGMITAE